MNKNNKTLNGNKLFNDIKKITKVTDRENANVGNSPSAKLLQIAEATSKEYAMNILIKDKNILREMVDLKIYPHDFSWASVGTTTCCFIPFGKLLSQGINTGHGFIRPAKRIRTGANLMCIYLQANQNSQHGGQASGWFDEELAPCVLNEYKCQFNTIVENLKELGIITYDEKEVESLAWRRTDEETFQAMEALVHNLNSMHSRAGSQVPFSSVNVGTGTSKAERMVTRNLLLAYEKGLGKGEQALFPNIVFKVKSGVNYEPETPNHDLLRLSLRVSANRLFPTYNFQDCSLNKDFPEDVPSMGCRTRVGFNRHSKEQTCRGRGNLSFTTINNVGVALDVKYNSHNRARVDKFYNIAERYNIELPSEVSTDLVKKYFVHLNKELDLAIRQLIIRYNQQCEFTVSDFPFLMDGVWMGSEKLNPTDTLESVLKHGTLTVGCIGIAETLKCLIGKHHGESKVALELGLQIIKFMRTKVDEAGDRYDLNFSLIATPAEGLTGKLSAYDRDKYGVIEGVTDKEWYTNSIHVPVEYEISAIRKIKIEGQFIKYFNGGSINYVELNESPLNNVDAMYTLIKAMYESDISIGAINFPCDRCLECGHHGTIEGDICPVCGSPKISRIARITGYLAEKNMFNHAKYMEQLHRVKHMFK